VNLAFRGIGGTFVQNIAADGSVANKFVAKMKALEAVDLYQQAGADFALLLSSVPPSSMPNVELHTLADQPEAHVHPQIKTDLVSVRYETTSSPRTTLRGTLSKTSNISIKFHELFVEWNPETLAAIHKAMRAAPVDESVYSTNLSCENVDVGASDCESEDEFFDAFDDGVESFCSASEMNDDKCSLELSEIASSGSSVCSEDINNENYLPVSPTHQLSAMSPTWITRSPNLRWPTSPLQPVLAQQLSPIRYARANSEDEITGVDVNAYEPFELVFELSTLRVAFNKESRHRRLVVAEMDSTSIRYATREEGGSRTTARIGNLVFTDPSFSDNLTLYNQILGLKTDGLTMNNAEPSLLELEFVGNNSKRNFESTLPSSSVS
jgi:hypothetical protein